MSAAPNLRKKVKPNYIPFPSKRSNFLRSDTTYTYYDLSTNPKKWENLWNISAGNIREIVANYISGYDYVIEQMLALPDAQQTYENTILQLDEYHTRHDFDINRCIFLQNVAESEELLNVSSDAEKQINIYMINTYMRKDLYNLAKSIYKKEKPKLHGEDLLYLTHLLKTFERNGLKLDNAKYTQVRELNERLTTLCTEFSMNISKSNVSISLTESELDGLPQSFINSLETEDAGNGTGAGDGAGDNTYIITTKYPHINPIYGRAKSAEVRKRIELMCATQCKENVAILFEIITVRKAIAELLGYTSWAEYMLEINMAKKVSTVDIFLSNLAEQLKPLRNRELDHMIAEKQGVIELYDWRYYIEKEKMEKYNIDADLLRDYFSLSHVLHSMFTYFADLLQITFEKSGSTAENKYLGWHPDVLEYIVHDRRTRQAIGKVYLDLFPRQNKFTHAACFPLKSSTRADPYAVCAIVCNFTSATDDVPSLLTHDEIETFYHEFGHAMHNVCSATYYAEFAGTQTDRDFVEAPSQMVENWCWEFNTIKQLGIHYKTGESIPDNMVNKLIATRYVGSGIFNCRQIAYAMIDLLLHTKSIENEGEMLDIFNKIIEEITGMPVLEDTFKLATFGHIAGGYDAQYYGYMWSKVYADDIYSHLMANKDNTGRYRDIILGAGGSVDGVKLVKRFLGREPNNVAFLRNLGL